MNMWHGNIQTDDKPVPFLLFVMTMQRQINDLSEFKFRQVKKSKFIQVKESLFVSWNLYIPLKDKDILWL